MSRNKGKIKILEQKRLLFPQILKKRSEDIHKKALAKVLVVAGSKGMTGAAVLTCKAALRAGAGMVCLAFPKSLKEIYKDLLIEALTLPCPATKQGTLSKRALKSILEKSKEYDVVAIGPGLSQNPETQLLIRSLLPKLEKPVILDADGINAIKDTRVLRQRKIPTIITPHPGEMARLLGIRVEAVQKDREHIAVGAAKKFRSIVVLKGYNTVIASKQGNVVVNKTGGPALATAGTGDVLLGIMSVLWAENLAYPFESAATAVHLHGLAGDLAAKELGERAEIASDVIKYLPKAFKIAG